MFYNNKIFNIELNEFNGIIVYLFISFYMNYHDFKNYDLHCID